MKKFLAMLLFLLLGVVLSVGSAWALPFSSTGVVDMNYLNSWDKSNLTGQALFMLYIDDTSVSVSEADLEFESDIFNLTNLAATDFSVLNPGDWSTIVTTGTNGYKFSVSSAGTNATYANDPIEILFNYTLLGPERFNNVSGSGWNWDEGQAWAVSYTLIGTFLNPGGLAVSSGSTAPVPEPATMLLFGVGLCGLAFVGRKKLIRHG